MAARILRAIVIVKDSDEDEKMENRDKEEEEEGRQSARQRWPGVSALRLSFDTPSDRRDPPFKIIISLVKLHKRS